MLRDLITRLYRRITGHGQIAKPWQHRWNVMETALSFSVSNNVVGDYLEFGVYGGGSFAHAYRYHETLIKRYRMDNRHRGGSPFLSYEKRFFAFDSFSGLPETDESLTPLHWHGPHAMACDRPHFLQNIRKRGVDLDRIHVIEGFYETSLTEQVLEREALSAGAIFHVDCDLEESTVCVLDFIRPLVTNGSVVVFDDYFYYGAHPQRGEQGAFNAWLRAHPELVATELCKACPAAAFVLNFVQETVATEDGETHQSAVAV